MTDADIFARPIGASAPSDGYVRTTRGRLYYLYGGGTGFSAHLLHANGFSAGTYAPFIRYPARDLTIFASDTRGMAAPIR